jgi:hypothetical protein
MPFLLLLMSSLQQKLEKRAEQFLPGREGDGGMRGRGEKWPKHVPTYK